MGKGKPCLIKYNFNKIRNSNSAICIECTIFISNGNIMELKQSKNQLDLAHNKRVKYTIRINLNSTVKGYKL